MFHDTGKPQLSCVVFIFFKVNGSRKGLHMYINRLYICFVTMQTSRILEAPKNICIKPKRDK